jgi:uncharacterized alkaline shock family protein YloU
MNLPETTISEPQITKISKLLETIEHLSTSPYFWIIASILLLLLISKLLINPKHPKELIVLESPEGNIKISRQAIIDLIQRISINAEGVGKCVTQINTKTPQLNIQTRIQIKEGNKVNVVSQKLQHLIKENLKDNVGFENIGTIEIIISGFMNDPTTHRNKTTQITQ